MSDDSDVDELLMDVQELKRIIEVQQRLIEVYEKQILEMYLTKATEEQARRLKALDALAEIDRDLI